jgi:hypothetical protein
MNAEQGGPYDSAAVGFTARADVACEQVIFYYLSASPRAEELSILAWMMPAQGIKPDIRPAAKDVIRIPFNKLNGDQLGDVYFVLSAMLGKAVYV